MAKYDPVLIWDAVVSYLGSSAAANVYALSPRPRVIQDDIEEIEDLADLVVVDPVGAEQDQQRRSGNNQHQTWNTFFKLYVGARGSSTALTKKAVMAVIGAIIEDLTGPGFGLNTDRSRVYSASIDRFDVSMTGTDALIGVGTLDATVIAYRH